MLMRERKKIVSEISDCLEYSLDDEKEGTYQYGNVQAKHQGYQV